ncbi:MAG: hypothetical protein IJD04_02015 [Desulfovibrionaceae bacterium]|nr:hypothetical protein [Desulfovibrionaceae bacterium]
MSAKQDISDNAKLSEQEKITQEKLDQIDKLITRLENTGLEEYIRLSQRTWKVLFMNLLSGVARGLGFTVGTAVVLTVVYKIVRYMIEMNIPYLTELLQEVVALAKGGQPPL